MCLWNGCSTKSTSYQPSKCIRDSTKFKCDGEKCTDHEDCFSNYCSEKKGCLTLNLDYYPTDIPDYNANVTVTLIIGYCIMAASILGICFCCRVPKKDE